MPHPVEPFRGRVPARLAAAVMISAGLGACSADMSRFNDNPFATGSVSRPAPTQQVAAAAPTGRVETQPLPQMQSTALPAPPPTVRSSTGPAPAAASASAPVRMSQGAPKPAQPASGVHVVAAGESLISISNKYGKPRGEVARANGIPVTTNVRIGQRLVIPGVPQHKIQTKAVAEVPKAPAARALALPAKPQTAAAQPPAAAPAQASAKPAKGTQVASLNPVVPAAAAARPEPVKERAHVASAPSDAAADAKESQPSATGAVPSFRWPVRGRVIAGFGPKPNGQQNDGINLAVPEGTSVKAAEDGVVAYAGNELKGYGNLVLVRHANGYVTAYAHASELKVKRGDAIKRGQIIALAGQTGSVASPQLHFEIRKGSTPVDPNQYLSGN